MEMNLGPVSYLDCAVFCLFLAPQLVWQAGLFETVLCVVRALPFFCTYPLSPPTVAYCSVEIMSCFTVCQTRHADEINSNPPPRVDHPLAVSHAPQAPTSVSADSVAV